MLETEHELFGLSRVPRTVLGTLVPRVRSASGADASGAWSRIMGSGFVTPRGTWSGLDGPMPAPITLVGTGRCRPSPDRVSLDPSSNRHGRSVVTAPSVVVNPVGHRTVGFDAVGPLLPAVREPHRQART